MDQQVEYYRKQAEACRALAGTSRSELTRARFLDLAGQWAQLADEREKSLTIPGRVPGVY